MGGKGGSSTTVQSYQPTDEEKRLWQLQAAYEEAVMPNALTLNDKAGNLLWDTIGDTKVDYNTLNNQANQRINNAISGYESLANGQLPTAYTDNINAQVKSAVNDSMGNLLQDYGAKGILNSSVTSQGIQGINQAATNTAAEMYNNDITQLGNIYSNLLNSAGSNISTSAAAQEAAQQPAINLWNASLGLDGSNLGAISAMGNKGTQTTTQTYNNGSNLFSGLMGAATGFASNYWGNSNCFAGDTKIKTADGDVKIKDIEVGDKVETTDGEKTVTAVMTPRYSSVYVLVTDDKLNKTVYLTDSQPLMKEDGEWATIKDIKVGDKLKGKGKAVSLIYSGDRMVYDLKVEGGMYYANGFIAKAATTEW